MPPSTLPTLAPFMPAASPRIAITAVARSSVPTVVPTQVRLSEPTAQPSNELVLKHDVVGLWWSRMMVFRRGGLSIRVQAAQGSLKLTPTEHFSTDVTLTRSSTSDLVAAPNTPATLVP